MHQGSDLREAIAFVVMAEHPRPLNLSLRRRARMGERSKFLQLFRGQHELGTLGRFRHGPYATARLGQMSIICSHFSETVYYYPPEVTIRVILDNHSAHISKETRAYLAT